MSAVWREVDHPSGAMLHECFDVQVSRPRVGGTSYPSPRCFCCCRRCYRFCSCPRRRCYCSGRFPPLLSQRFLQRARVIAFPFFSSWQVMAIPHPRYHAVAYATAIEALKQKLQAMEPSTMTTGFRDRVTRAWQAVRDAGATMIPAKVSKTRRGGEGKRRIDEKEEGGGRKRRSRCRCRADGDGRRSAPVSCSSRNDRSPCLSWLALCTSHEVFSPCTLLLRTPHSHVRGVSRRCVRSVCTFAEICRVRTAQDIQ